MNIPLPKFPGANCMNCTLSQMNGYPKPVFTSSTIDEVKLIVVGSMPTYAEVTSGQLLNSEVGEVLSKIVPEEVEVYYTTALACRTPNNRPPTSHELACCKGKLEIELSAVPLKDVSNILTLGEVATNQVFEIYGVLPDSDKISKIRGKGFVGTPTLFLPERTIYPTYAPSYVLQNAAVKTQFNNDVLLACGTEVRENILAEIPEYEVLKTTEDIHRLLRETVPYEPVAFDIETTNLQWYGSSRPADVILAIGFATEKKIWIIEWSDALANDTEAIYILKVFCNTRNMIAHNGKFDQLFLREHLGITFRLWFDTLLAHAELFEEQKHSLKELATEYFGIPDYEKELIEPYLSKNQQLKNYAKIPTDILYKYLAIDLFVTVKLQPIFMHRMIKEGTIDYFLDFVMNENATALEMQFNGMLVDTVHLDEVKIRLEDRAKALVESLRQASGNPTFNPNSPKQVAIYLYDDLDLPEIEYKHKVGGVWKTDVRSTSKTILEQLPQTPEVQQLLEYKQISKLVSNYTDSILDLVDWQNRVHPDILVFGTETGRWSVTNPPLHNIPRSEDKGDGSFDYGGLIRSSFIAGEGRKLVICDYSQAELRILAALSGDPFLLDAYNNDRDLHTEMAKTIAPNGQWTKHYRAIAKKINFGFVYYAGAYIIAQQANIPIELARKLVEKAQQTMSRAVQWRQEQLEFAQKNGYVETRFGKRRHLPLITAGNIDNMKKAAVNSPIQGGAGQLTALAAHNILLHLQKHHYNAKLLLSVHDSIIIECDKKDADDISAALAHAMIDSGERIYPEVKWVAEPEIKDRWADIPKENDGD